MKGFGFYVRLYFIIIAQYLKSRMAYKVDFLISSVGMLFGNITGFLGLWVLFKNIPALAGWRYEELVFIYAFSLIAVTPLQVFFDNIWSLRTHIQSGTFIKYYFKPINMMFYYMSEMVDLKGIAQFLTGVVLMVVSSSQLGLVWTLPSVLALVALLFSASLVLVSLVVIAGSTAFWITNSYSILDFAIRFQGYAKYPTTIFDNFFRALFTFVIPVGFIAFYPSQAILRPGQSDMLVYFTPLIGIGMFIIACSIWARGVRQWSGTGS